MSSVIHIANAYIVNNNSIRKGDVIIENEIIRDVVYDFSPETPQDGDYIEAGGLFLIPGVIDAHVHFREPGFTHKADILHESMAAVAGGVTSYMEMPNTSPPATTLELLEKKYESASINSMANYSFYLGIANDNVAQILKAPLDTVCGLKMFLGSLTGRMLTNNFNTQEKIFSETPHIIAVHCEDDTLINKNLEKFKEKYGENIPFYFHHRIRNVESCVKSSSKIINLAEKHNTKLHICHLSTADELVLLRNDIPLEQKRITAEVCVHHLWFTAEDYLRLGQYIKWNPSIKEKKHRSALRNALKEGLIDIVATDHAPHLKEEKETNYENCPSGAPYIQFSLQMMLELVHEKVFTIEEVVQFMCHNPARLFNISKRGFICEGYYADLVLVNMNKPYIVTSDKIFSKCKWTPLEGKTFHSTIEMTLINGKTAWYNNKHLKSVRGKRIAFDRQ